jgi:hypothetical protein
LILWDQNCQKQGEGTNILRHAIPCASAQSQQEPGASLALNVGSGAIATIGIAPIIAKIVTARKEKIQQQGFGTIGI